MSGRVGKHRANMSPEQLELFRAELNRLMKENKLRGDALAEMLGVSAIHISKIRNGHAKPSKELAENIADAFGQTVEMMSTPREEVVAKTRAAIGKNLMERRIAHSFKMQEVAGFIGTTKEVYTEMERGQCSISDWQMDALTRLYADREVVETVEVVKEVPVDSGLTLETVEILLSHINDIDIGNAEKRVLFKNLSNIRTSMLEAELFG